MCPFMRSLTLRERAALCRRIVPCTSEPRPFHMFTRHRQHRLCLPRWKCDGHWPATDNVHHQQYPKNVRSLRCTLWHTSGRSYSGNRLPVLALYLAPGPQGPTRVGVCFGFFAEYGHMWNCLILAFTVLIVPLLMLGGHIQQHAMQCMSIRHEYP